MKFVSYFIKVFLIVAGVLMLMVLGDMLNPYKEIKVTVDPSFIVYPDYDIRNPINQPYVLETAFNLGISPDQVTQSQFNQRYLNK